MEGEDAGGPGKFSSFSLTEQQIEQKRKPPTSPDHTLLCTHTYIHTHTTTQSHTHITHLNIHLGFQKASERLVTPARVSKKCEGKISDFRVWTECLVVLVVNVRNNNIRNNIDNSGQTAIK